MNNQTLLHDNLSNAQVKRGIYEQKRKLTRKIPDLIVISIFVIVVLMTFADFKLANVCTLGFALKTVAFVGLSYLLYYTKKYLGKQKGQRDKTYTQGKEDHSKACADADPYNKQYPLSDFCEEWTLEERDRARGRELSGGAVTEEEWKKFEPLGQAASKIVYRKKRLKRMLKQEKISEDEYDLICELKKLPGNKRLAIARACMIEKLRLTPADILYESISRDGREQVPINIRRKNYMNDIISLAPLTIMMVGVIAFFPEIAGVTFDIKTVIYGLMRVLSLLVTSFRGEMNGETIYTVDSVDNFKIQMQFIGMYAVRKAEKAATEEGVELKK